MFKCTSQGLCKVVVLKDKKNLLIRFFFLHTYTNSAEDNERQGRTNLASLVMRFVHKVCLDWEVVYEYSQENFSRIIGSESVKFLRIQSLGLVRTKVSR